MGGGTKLRPDCDAVPEVSRIGFVQELLFPQGTSRTPRFEDSVTSYHAAKLDVLDGIREARGQGYPVLGLAVLGPDGPLWSYLVVAILREDDHLRVNSVNFAHARITEKRTRIMTMKEYKAIFDALGALSCMAKGIPSFETLREARTPKLSLDSHYRVLLADWSTAEERDWHAVGHTKTLTDDDAKAIWAQFSAFINGTTTYTTTLPEGIDILKCAD
jgi:hypothetical protein